MSDATPRYEAPNSFFEQAVKERILGRPGARFFGFRFGALKAGCAEIAQPHRKKLSHREGFSRGRHRCRGRLRGRGISRISAAWLGERHRRLHRQDRRPGRGRGTDSAGKDNQARSYTDGRRREGACPWRRARNPVCGLPRHLP